MSPAGNRGLLERAQACRVQTGPHPQRIGRANARPGGGVNTAGSIDLKPATFKGA